MYQIPVSILTPVYSSPTLNADVYVLCYHKEENIDRIDPMDLSQWDFWIFTKEEIVTLLNGRKSISISQLHKEGHSPVDLAEIRAFYANAH